MKETVSVTVLMDSTEITSRKNATNATPVAKHVLALSPRIVRLAIFKDAFISISASTIVLLLLCIIRISISVLIAIPPVFRAIHQLSMGVLHATKAAIFSREDVSCNVRLASLLTPLQRHQVLSVLPKYPLE